MQTYNANDFREDDEPVFLPAVTLDPKYIVLADQRPIHGATKRQASERFMELFHENNNEILEQTVEEMYYSQFPSETGMPLVTAVEVAAIRLFLTVNERVMRRLSPKGYLRNRLRSLGIKAYRTLIRRLSHVYKQQA